MKTFYLFVSILFLYHVNGKSQVILDPNNLIIGMDSINGEAPTNKGFMYFSEDKGAFVGGKKDDNLIKYFHIDSVGNSSFGFGENVHAKGEYSVAIGRNVFAREPHSLALGYIAEAHGFGSIAFGSNATAFGEHSIASGSCTTYGCGSVAMGYLTESHGSESFTMGNITRANASASLVIGAYNDTVVAVQDSYDPNTFSPLFIIGNGTNLVRENAFEVYNDGFFVFNPKVTTRDFQITNYNNGSEDHPVFRASQDGFGYVGTAQTELRAVYANEVYANLVSLTSDRNLKHNIESSMYGLEDIMALKPMTYAYIDDIEEKEHIGFIAQDVAEILPQLVHEKGDGNLSVNYLEIIPVLVKGMQDQQNMIESLRKENQEIKAVLTDMADKLELLVKNQ